MFTIMAIVSANMIGYYSNIATEKITYISYTKKNKSDLFSYGLGSIIISMIMYVFLYITINIILSIAKTEISLWFLTNVRILIIIFVSFIYYKIHLETIQIKDVICKYTESKYKPIDFKVNLLRFIIPKMRKVDSREASNYILIQSLLVGFFAYIGSCDNIYIAMLLIIIFNIEIYFQLSIFFMYSDYWNQNEVKIYFNDILRINCIIIKENETFVTIKYYNHKLEKTLLRAINKNEIKYIDYAN